MDGKELTAAGFMAEDLFIRQMKRRRAGLELSQGELAERVVALGGSMYQQTIAKLESGQRALKLSEADLIAQALGTTVQDMLSSAVTSAASKERRKPPTLEELEAERAAMQRRLAVVHDEERSARDRLLAARAAYEAARHALKDAELREREAQSRGAQLAAQLDFLGRRIRELRVEGGDSRGESSIDEVLHEAEPAIDALEGVASDYDAGDRSKENNPRKSDERGNEFLEGPFETGPQHTPSGDKAGVPYRGSKKDLEETLMRAARKLL